MIWTNLFLLIQVIVRFLVFFGLINIFVSFVLASVYNFKERLRIRRLARQGINVATYYPTVSVIVPAFNEEVGILKTIKSLLATNYPYLEIIVVDDGSKDRTADKVKSLIKYWDSRYPQFANTVKLVCQPNGGKGKALNAGLKLAKGDLILTMDADSAITKQGLHNLVKYFADPKIMSVVGNVEVANNNSWVGEIQKLEYLFGFYLKRAHSVLGVEYIFGGACACYRKEVFAKLGGFDEENKTEDIEMSVRTRFYGLECVFAEDVVVFTEGASDMAGLIKQRVRWKKGRFDTFLKYSNLFFSTSEIHNGWLTFYQLPMALVGECLLFLAPFALSFLIFYSVFTWDYINMAINFLFLGIFYVMAGFFANRFRPLIVLKFPFTWTMFVYFIYVEYVAQAKSFYLMLRKENVEWQRWVRRGISTPL